MKKQYKSPEFTVVTFEVERGFTGTGTGFSPVQSFDMQMMDQSISDKNQASQFSYSQWNW